MEADAEVARLAEAACRPDRLYPIQSEKHYGHWAGRLPDGRQALVTCGCTHEVRAFLFTAAGDYLGVERREPRLAAAPEEPWLDLNERELLG